MKYEQKQIVATLGTHHPLSIESSNVIKCVKLLFEECEKNSTNGTDFKLLYHYLDLFLEHERDRSFLMDRLYDLIIECGSAWFDDKS